MSLHNKLTGQFTLLLHMEVVQKHMAWLVPLDQAFMFNSIRGLTEHNINGLGTLQRRLLRKLYNQRKL